MPRRLLLICPCTAPVVGSGSRFSRADLEAISRNHEVEAVYLSRFSSPHLLKPRLPAARSGAGTSSVRAPVEDSCQLAVEFRRETPQQRGRRLVGSRAARACALGSGAAQPRRGTRRVALYRRRTAAQAGATARGNRNRKGSAHAGAGIACENSTTVAPFSGNGARVCILCNFTLTAHGASGGYQKPCSHLDAPQKPNTREIHAVSNASRSSSSKLTSGASTTSSSTR
jgi:hypothetical protein